MEYPPAAADPVDAGLPDGGMPAAGKGGGRRSQISRRIPQSLKSPAPAASPPPEGQIPLPRRQSIRWTDRPAGRHHHQRRQPADAGGVGGPDRRHHRRTRRRRRCAVSQKREGRINGYLVSQYPAGSSQRHGDPGGDLPAAVGVFRVFTGLVAGGAAGRAAAYERQSAPAAGGHAKRLRQQEGLSGGEDLEKRGEVYYDAKTGTYYIVPNAAGN